MERQSRAWKRRLSLPLVVLATVAVAVSAQMEQIQGADYKGDRLCLACHSRTHKAITDGYKDSAHANAMREATDESIMADFANAPFKRDQVAYVLAGNRHAQAYLDADLNVLPGIWRIDEERWIPQPAANGATDCIGCHVTNFNPEQKTWTALGVGCESCHGPGSKHNTSRDDRAGTIINPATDLDKQHQAMVCGQCHSQGRSRDGRYAFPHQFLPGMDLDTVFADSAPQGPGRNQQFSDLRRSPAHWEAGVVCEDCHDPHGNTDEPYQLKAPINDTCLQCHEDDVHSLEAHVQEHGHTPTPDMTCATCHMPEGRHLFDHTMAAPAAGG